MTSRDRRTTYRLLLQAVAWAAAVTATSSVAAQPLIGTGVGYEFGAPLAIERAPGRVNRYVSVDGFGTSSNHVAWLGAWLDWPGLLGSDIGLRARLRLATEQGEFLSDPYIRDSARIGLLIRFPVTRRFHVSTSISGLILDLGATFRPFDAVSIHAGPWLGYRIASAVEERETIESPDTMTYADGTRQMAIASGDEISSTSLRGGLGVSLAWSLRAGGAVRIMPELGTRIDADALGRGLGVRAMTIGAGVSLVLDPFHESPIDDAPARGTVPVTAMASTMAPEVSLALRGGDGASELVVSGASTLRRSIVPFPPAIPADSVLISAAPGEPFELRDLAGREPRGIYDRIVDVLGLRLRDDPTATVELSGLAASGEPDSLGRRRAATVAAYLRRVWGVDQKRITVTHGRVERAGPASVAVLSRSRALTAPVEVTWIERRPTAPAISVDPTIRARAGVMRWRIDLWFGDDAIGRYTGEGATLPRAVAPTLPLERHRGSGTLPPIVAEIQVVDSNGRLAESRAELPVRRAPAARAGVDAERIELLVPAGVEIRESILERLAASLAEGARVTILREPSGDGAVDDLPARIAARVSQEAAARGITLASIDTGEMKTGGGYPAGASVRVIVEREVK